MFKKFDQTRVDRDKPRNLELGLWFIDFGLLLLTEDDSGQGYQLDHSLSQRLLKHLFDNVLLEHVGLVCVLPPAVHLFFWAE